MQTSGLNDQIFIPRPSVPFEPLKLPPLPMAHPNSTPKQASPTPKLNYPVLKVSTRPTLTARQLAQQNIQQELTQLNQNNNANLDQLIQNAINLKIHQDYHPIPQPKIVSVTTSPLPQKRKQVTQPAISKSASRDLWWPDQPVAKKVATPVTATPAKEPTARITPPPKVNRMVTPTVKLQPKPVQTESDKTQLIDYLLFSIPRQENPFDDPNRRRVIFGLKITGYLILLLAVSEFRRYLLGGFNLNGFLEVISILFVASIFFFFGHNLSILFKPNDPYQIQEIV